MSGNHRTRLDPGAIGSSTAVYQIVLNNGQRLEGKIEKESPESGKLEDFLIHEASGEVQVASVEITSVDTKKTHVLAPTTGSNGLGL